MINIRGRTFVNTRKKRRELNSAKKLHNTVTNGKLDIYSFGSRFKKTYLSKFCDHREQNEVHLALTFVVVALTEF